MTLLVHTVAQKNWGNVSPLVIATAGSTFTHTMGNSDEENRCRWASLALQSLVRELALCIAEHFRVQIRLPNEDNA